MIRNDIMANNVPHIKGEESTHSIMLDVIISLLPAVIVGTFVFGLRTLLLVAVSICSALLFEYLSCKILKRKSSIDDLSAVVTGILFAFTLPVSAPIWIPIAGMFIARAVSKQLSGGIGKNILSPALGAWAILRIIFPSQMTSFTSPRETLSLIGSVTVESVQTPLGILYEGGAISGVNWLDMLLGQTAGGIGSTSAAAILAGGIYLLVRRVISHRITLSYLAVVAVISFIMPGAGLDNLTWTVCQLFGGMLMLGAVYMANDYTTSPVSPAGQWLYGTLCGILTVALRMFKVYPDGTAFAILIANLTARGLDMLTLKMKNRN